MRAHDTLRILYYNPEPPHANRYAELQMRVLQEIGAEVKPLSLLELLRCCASGQKTITILNHFEDRLGYHKSRQSVVLAQNAVALLLTKLACRRIVWVRHNLWPHGLDRNSIRQRILLWLMGKLATVTVTHRSVTTMPSLVVPHPLYYQADFTDAVRDIEFLYFGAIKRYKGLDVMISAWPKDKRLIIAGVVVDAEAFAELSALATKRGLDVEFIPKLLPENELNALLVRTKYVLLPHRDDSMIVAGTFYHAASCGANVMANETEFGKYLRNEFLFVNTFNDANLIDVISQLKYVEPDTVVQQVLTTNGTTACREAWKAVINATGFAL